MFIVSWFADDVKWENMLLVPFYAQGLTYFRPFRYREAWISAKLLGQLQQSIDDVTKLSEEEGTLLCAKFKSSELLIPIRQIGLTQISKGGNDYYLYFRLGRFIDYRDSSSLLEYTGQIKDAIDVGDRQKLFHQSSINLGSLSFIKEYDIEAENESWTRFVDLLCSEQGLPLDPVRQSVFLKLAGIRQQNETENLKPQRIGGTNIQGDIYGYELKEGKSYELELLHRVPSLIGTNLRMKPFEYQISFAEQFTEVVPRDVEVSGNYKHHVFLLQAKEASAMQDLQFVAPSTKSTDCNGKTLYVESIHLNFKNKFSLFELFRKRGLAIVILFCGIFVGLLADAATKVGWEKAFFSYPTIWKAVGSFAVIYAVYWLRWRR